MKSRYLVLLIVVLSLAAIVYGFTIEETQPPLAHKCIGGGTVGLFLIAMPLFLYKESKGKKLKDYMLSEENIKKMQAKEQKKTKNQ